MNRTEQDESEKRLEGPTRKAPIRFWSGLRSRIARVILLPQSELPTRPTLFRLIFASLLATILWIGVSASQDPVRFLTYTNIPITAHYPHGYYAAQGLPNATVRVEGLASDLSEIVRPSVSADLTGVSPGSSHPRSVSVHVQGLSSRVRVLEIAPRMVLLQLEKASTMSIPVVIQGINTLPGYEVRRLVGTPTRLLITGPSHVVRSALEARILLNEAGLTRAQSFSIVPTILSRTGSIIPSNVAQTRPLAVHVSIDVRLQPVQQLASIIPSLSGSVAPGYRITSVIVSPPLVRVVSSSFAARGISLGTEPLVVTGWSTSHILFLQIRPPTGVTLRGAGHVTVTVSVAPAFGSATTTAILGIRGARGGTRVLLSPTSISVADEGPLTSLSTAPYAFVDVRGRAPGTYYISPTIGSPTIGSRTLSILPTKIRVTITSAR